MLLFLLLASLTLAVAQDRPWLRRADSNNQYQFNDDENSWVYARERCRAQGADLVSINDKQELVTSSVCFVQQSFTHRTGFVLTIQFMVLMIAKLLLD